jgi:hypothetical protein
MVDDIAQAKLAIRLIDVTVCRANSPDSVKNQRIETAVQKQRKEAEQARAAAGASTVHHLTMHG